MDKKYSFRWEVLDIIVGGRSSIDSATGFQLANMDEADRFVKSYGFNFDNPIESAEAFGNFHEALNFIRRYFMQPENPQGLRLEVPRKILELTDIRELFLMASQAYPGQSSDTMGVLLKNWACSILKVMHTIAHVDQDIRVGYFADIQKQIFDRYYRYIHRDPDGQLYLGEKPEDPLRVNLVAFETKPKKARDSTLLKLLHKPENVAEDIFDRVGIRFVTFTRIDTLRVIKYLTDKMIVMPPNIKPSRSRNTLIDMEELRGKLPDLVEQMRGNRNDLAPIIKEIEAIAQGQAPNSDNPHSSEHYRAIQFTCRQLIKLKNQLYDDIKSLKQLAKNQAKSVVGDDELQKAVEKLDLKSLQKEVRFFYPYEVQLVDQQSFEDNEKGRSAHSEYKKAQLNTALKRVMGPLSEQQR